MMWPIFVGSTGTVLIIEGVLSLWPRRITAPCSRGVLLAGSYAPTAPGFSSALSTPPEQNLLLSEGLQQVGATGQGVFLVKGARKTLHPFPPLVGGADQLGTLQSQISASINPKKTNIRNSNGRLFLVRYHHGIRTPEEFGISFGVRLVIWIHFYLLCTIRTGV